MATMKQREHVQHALMESKMVNDIEAPNDTQRLAKPLESSFITL